MPPKRARPALKPSATSTRRTSPSRNGRPKATGPAQHTRKTTVRDTAAARGKVVASPSTRPQVASERVVEEVGVEEEEEEEEEEDVTNGLVRNSKKVRPRGRGRPRKKQDTFIAGGLGSPDPDREARLSGSEARGVAAAAEERSGSGGDVVRTATVSAAAGRGRSGAGSNAGRKQGPLVSERTPTRNRPHAVDTDTGARGRTNHAAASRAVTSQIDAMAPGRTAPVSRETSVLLAKGTFRMRPREPSLLTLAQAGKLESSVIGGVEGSLLASTTDDFDLSALDTTAELTEDTTREIFADIEATLERRQSDARLARSEQAAHTDIPSEDPDIFDPPLQGTPLPARMTPASQVVPAHAQQQNHAYADDDEDLYTLSPRKKRGTKRKSAEITRDDGDVPDNSQRSPRPPTLQQQQQQRTAERDGTVIEVMRSSPPPIPRSSSSPLSIAPSPSPRRSSPRKPDLDSETYASPLSSSPLSSPVDAASPSPNKRKKQQQQQQRRTELRGEKRVTSAMLRALLPRRQSRRQEDCFDISGIDDETKVQGIKKRGRRKVLGETKGRRNLNLDGGAKGVGKRSGRPVQGPEKENADGGTVEMDDGTGMKRARQAVKKGRGKTYSRRRREEDDDEGGDDDESDDGAPLSKELQAARAKFRQIDRAVLDCESVSISGGSSPWR